MTERTPPKGGSGVTTPSFIEQLVGKQGWINAGDREALGRVAYLNGKRLTTCSQINLELGCVRVNILEPGLLTPEWKEKLVSFQFPPLHEITLLVRGKVELREE